MAKSISIVTGIPGTGVEKSLIKAKTVSQRRRIGTQITKVTSLEKEYLQPKAKRYVERLGLHDNHIMSVLTLPQPLLQKLWVESFEKAMNALSKDKSQGTALLTFHSCYYHLQTKQYVSIVDFDTILKWKESIAAIITLIDDVFDCQQRLCAARGRRLLDPPRNLEESLLQLLQLLHWRKQEILISKSLARACGKELAVYGAKHSVDNFLRMLDKDTLSVYLSHPISDVRQAYKSGETSVVSAFTEEYRKHLEMLQTRFVVFEPTSIDEYRFAVGASLGRRWPLDGDIPAEAQLLWTKPQPCRSDYIFPSGWEDDNRALNENAQPLVAYVSDLIDRHTTGTDYQLIDQSNLVYAFRPLAYGRASTGVEKELKYAYARHQLGLLKDSGPFAIIFSPSSDQEDYPFRSFWDGAISRWAEEQRIKATAAQVEKLKKALLRDETRVRGWIEAGNQAELTTYLIEQIQECAITFSAEERSRRPMVGDSKKIRHDEATRCAQKVVELHSERPYIEGFGLPIYPIFEEAEDAVTDFCHCTSRNPND